MGGGCVEGLSGIEFSLHGDIVFCSFGEWWRSGCFAMSLRHTYAARRVVAGSFWFIRVRRLAEVSRSGSEVVNR